MKYRVTHTTHYIYSEPVSSCQNIGHLRLRSSSQQTCTSSRISINPMPAVSNQWQDMFGNHLDYFAIQQAHSELTVSSQNEVEVISAGTLLDTAYPVSCEQARLHLQADIPDEQVIDARQFVLESPFVEFNSEIYDFGAASLAPERSYLDAVRELMGRIHHEFSYDPEFSDIATPLAEVLKHRKGVCQDFAHLAIACLRAHGLAARYVSGYLETLPPAGSQRLVGADESHAWFSVFVPYRGWVDFDPTNDQIPADQHITAAWGRDYADVAPLKGVLFGGGDKHDLNVSVDVERI